MNQNIKTGGNNFKRYYNRKIMLKFLLRFGILIFLIFFFSLYVLSVLKGKEEGLILVGKYSFSYIKSGSMEPTYKVGTVVFTKKEDSYGYGDVITYITENPDKTSEEKYLYYTHRIVGVGDYYSTRGDNITNSKDEDQVYQENIIGKVIGKSYILGRILLFCKLIPAKYFYAAMIFCLTFIIALLLILKTNLNELPLEKKIDYNNKLIRKRIQDLEDGKVLDDESKLIDLK